MRVSFFAFSISKLPRDDVLAIGDHAGEVADTAADFYDALAEWGHGETGLPLEIIDSPRHALLVADGVIAGC